MSGHSKWSTIKRQKGAADVERGTVFTKLSNAITLAARLGRSGDPQSNFRLRLAIETAKAANMPKVNIERAIAHAVANTNDKNLDEVVYEGFAPYGIAVIAEGVTDNKQRTAAAVKNIFSVHGGVLSGVGSVSYLFEQTGVIIISQGNNSQEKMLDYILNSGASDYVENGGVYTLYTKPGNLHQVKEFLGNQKLSVTKVAIIYKPITLIDIDVKNRGKIDDLKNALIDLDDIQTVFSNAYFI